MTVSDPIADMLTRIRNATMVRHASVSMPSSKMKIAIAKILKEEGFIRDFDMVRGKPQRSIRVHLKYLEKEPVVTGLERISKPGLRVYVHKNELPRVYGGIGIAILSTPRGVMTGRQAWRMGIGGEMLCYVW